MDCGLIQLVFWITRDPTVTDTFICCQSSSVDFNLGTVEGAAVFKYDENLEKKKVFHWVKREYLLLSKGSIF